MSGLITVEDYNSTLLNFTGLFWYEIDCNKLWEIGLQSDEFYYDWIRVVKDGDNFNLYGIYGFPLWTGGVRTEGLLNIGTYSNPPYITIGVSEYEEDKGKAYFEMGINHFDSGEVTSYFFAMEGIILDNNLFVKTPKTFQFEVDWALRYYPFKLHLKRLDGTIIELTNPTIEEGSGRRRLTFEYDGSELIQNTIKLIYNAGYPLDKICHFSINQFKSPNFLNITGNLYIGKSNNELTIKPFISGVKCKLSYLDKEETILLGDTQQVNIDLSQKTDLKDITLKVELAEGPNSNKETLTYKVPVEYQTISTFSDLATELSVNTGNALIRLGADLTATSSNIPINRDVIIYGNNKTIDLDEGHFTIKPGVIVKWYDTTFTGGDNAFIQKENSTLELEGCTFTSCTSTSNEGIGSCIYCDIDLSSLNIPNDFKTSIISTTFTDCHGAILHGGELNVENCHYTITTTEVMNPNSPYFLYQTDGGANLEGNTFDIDLTEDNGFCTDEKNANLAQCLFVCGENAQINGVSSYELQNNTDPFGTTYRNQSHIFLKYYYPQLETCVFISPTTGYETRALCYGISGVDYIFKRNVQVTRASWGTENTNNPLRGA